MQPKSYLSDLEWTIRQMMTLLEIKCLGMYNFKKGEVILKIIADTHCHTIASTHAYSTIEEMAKAATEKGLYAIAITDHGRTMPGAPGQWYFENMCVLPDQIHGVQVIKGIESNVYDYNGNLDLTPDILKSVKWIIASMHEITLKPIYDIEACTNAWMNVAKNPWVNVIGHSGVEAFKFDYETVIKEFGRNGKLIEINNTSFRVRKSAIKNCKTIALLCKKHGVNLVVNSDAHFSSQIGVVDNAMELLKEVDFPKELILNANLESFKEYLTQNFKRKELLLKNLDY